MNNPFLSFKHKNYRYYICGMLISNIGTWMQNVAQPWLAYQITNDAFKISLVSALQFTPMLLFSLFAGAIIEKLDKKTMLLITQSMLFITTMMFAVLVFTNQIRYWQIVLLATVMGFATAFDMPIRQAFVIELVPKDDLMNAIALNSTVFNLARMIGPGIAGIIMGAYGAGFCFLLNSVSFLAVIISLIFVKPLKMTEAPAEKHVQTIKSIFADVLDGLKYLSQRKKILYILLSTFVVSCFSMNHNVLLPVFVTNILHMQEDSFGFILTCMGIGSFAGSLIIASSSKKGPNAFFITFGSVIVGAGLIMMGIMGNYIAAMVLYLIIGFSYVCYSSTANTSIQLMVRNEYRSRVMSVYALTIGGTIPIGSLITGLLISAFGIQAAYLIDGGIIVVFMLIFSWLIIKRTE